MAIGPRAAARAVANLLRAAHAAREGVVAQHALPAILAAEYGFLERVLTEQDAFVERRVFLGEIGYGLG
jgi:hypothetical protein